LYLSAFSILVNYLILKTLKFLIMFFATIFYKFSSSAEDMKIVTKNESSVQDDIPRSISSSRDEILLVGKEFHPL
jgi:hypothetical protein